MRAHEIRQDGRTIGVHLQMSAGPEAGDDSLLDRIVERHGACEVVPIKPVQKDRRVEITTSGDVPGVGDDGDDGEGSASAGFEIAEDSEWPKYSIPLKTEFKSG